MKLKLGLKKDYKLMLFVGIFFIIFGWLFGFLLIPKLFNKMIQSQMNVAKGSKIRPSYEKTPFFVDYRIYVFNVTNKDEVYQGKKPKLQEIGPYFFEEWKEKYDLVDNEKEDTLTYHYKNTFIFRPDLSGRKLTGNEMIIMPHPLIMGMLLSVNVDKKPFLPTIEGAIKKLFHDPADAFYKGRVMDLLYNGVDVDCSSDDAAVAAICLEFDNQKAFRKIDDHHFTFSLFAGVNGTDMGEMKVLRGKKNFKDVGRVLTYNGETEPDVWNGDECNQYVGTDTTIIPALMTPDEQIWGYDPSICRSIGASYRSETTYKKVPVAVYEMDLSEDINVKPCFCRDDDTCPPKGTFDLYPCVGVPMIASLPHFYKAEQLLDGIASGLRPKKAEHGIRILLETITGTPLSAAKRLQFSLEVKPIPEVEWMKNMPEVVLPMFWVEEGAHLGTKYTVKLQASVFSVVFLMDVFKWGCVGFGFMAIFGAAAWKITGEGVLDTSIIQSRQEYLHQIQS